MSSYDKVSFRQGHVPNLLFEGPKKKEDAYSRKRKSYAEYADAK